MNADLTCTTAPDDSLAVSLTGDWLLDAVLPGIEPIFERLQQAPAPVGIRFETDGLGDWDTGLVARLVSIRQAAEQQGIPVDDSGLPEGARQLVALRSRSGSARVRDAAHATSGSSKVSARSRSG